MMGILITLAVFIGSSALTATCRPVGTCSAWRPTLASRAESRWRISLSIGLDEGSRSSDRGAAAVRTNSNPTRHRETTPRRRITYHLPIGQSLLKLENTGSAG